MTDTINTTSIPSLIPIEIYLKENFSTKKIIKIKPKCTLNELTKILSNKFNCKIKSIGITKSNTENYLITNDVDLDFAISIIQNKFTKTNTIKLFCSPNLLDIEPFNNSNLKSNPDPILKIYANNSYVPTQAQSQLEDLGQLNGVMYLVGMPDLHQGKFPIGSVVITQDNWIYPDLVGTDIGCGMSLIKTSIYVNKYSSKQLERLASKMDIGKFVFESGDYNTHYNKYYSNTIEIHSKLLSNPIDSTWWENKNYGEKINNLLTKLSTKYVDSMGTIGLGNHFVELLEFDKLKSPQLVNKYSIDTEVYWIVVHSGSRGLGEEIFGLYQSKQIDLDEYLILHDYAIEWAQHNRFAIVDQFKNYISNEVQCEYLLDLTHNWVERTIDSNNQTQLNIHRKGAAPSYTGPIVIPGSRGTRTWLVEPNAQTHGLETGYSVSHGAGRKISRNKAYDHLNTTSEKDREICCQGDVDITNIVVCEDSQLYMEEAPFAYKDIQAVIDDLEFFNLAIPICSFVPKITFKCKK